MTHKEKSIIVALISSFLVFGIYVWLILGMYQSGRFDGSDAAALMGKSILLLILAGIAVNIAVTITFHILFAIATNDPKPSFLVDERDKLIELKGMQAMVVTFGFGLVAAMAVLALGTAPHTVFLGIIVTMFAASAADDITRLYLYRRGF
jgi:hypothetical protein